MMGTLATVALVCIAGSTLAERRQRSDIGFVFEVAAAVIYAACAFHSARSGDPVGFVISAAACGVWAYIAWRNWPRNKRLPDKLAGVVRDLGHRLVVVAPVPAGGKS